MKSWTQPINLVRTGSFLLFLSLAVTIASLFLLKTKLSAQHRLILDHTHALIPAERMRSAMQGYVASERGFLLTGEADFIERLSTADEEFRRYLFDLREWIRTAKGDKYLSEIIAAEKEHRDAVNRVHALRQEQGLNDAIIATFQKEIFPRRQTLQNLVNELVQYKEQELLRVEEESKVTTAWTITAIMCLAAFSILLLGMLFLHLSKKLLRLFAEAKESEKKIRGLAEELSRSNAELERFASIASHDLRSPLNTITNFGKLLEPRVKDSGDKEAQEYVHFMVDGAARMRQLVDGLLDYARVSNGESSFERIPLASVVDDAKVNLRREIETSGAQIVCDPLPEINGDRVQLRQLFSNLIGNAIHYRGKESPRIKISANEENTGWRISVSDNGAGVDMKHAEQIFLPFKRLHSQQQKPGTGLGLSICRSVVERHGGKIWLKSEIGHGSEFLIKFPKSPEPQNDDGKITA